MRPVWGHVTQKINITFLPINNLKKKRKEETLTTEKVNWYNYEDHITKHKQKTRAQKTRGLIRLGSLDTLLIVSVKAGGCGCCPEITSHQNFKKKSYCILTIF